MAPQTFPRYGPWAALIPLLAGFFVVIAGSSVVTVATSAIATDLNVGAGAAVWVTSSYLLALVSPLLLAGRLGDRFGPRSVYVAGLIVFTGGSIFAGTSGAIGPLVLARVVQGLGASLMTPQSLTVITKLFPVERRGPALGVWGATSGVALLAGPLLGGVLIQLFGWPSIFLINLPLGLITIGLVIWLVPAFDHQAVHLDVFGTVLSAIGILLVAFAIQQGPSSAWGELVGWVTVPMLLFVGIAALLGFVVWQRSRRNLQPLMPAALFRDRNFALSNGSVFAAGFVTTSIALPILIWAQDALRLSPFGSALLIAPVAVMTIVFAPLVGRAISRISPRTLATTGFVGFVVSLLWIGLLIGTSSPPGWLSIPAALLGIASACVWGPLAVSATADVAPQLAGAGSGVYNTMRQLGGVFGIAAVSVGMQATIAIQLPERVTNDGSATLGQLPRVLAEPFGVAMATTLLIPAAVALIGVVVSAFLRVRRSTRPSPSP